MSSAKQSNENSQLVEGFLKITSIKVEAALERFLYGEDEKPEKLHEAVRYSMFAGGKRLRPALALAAFQACQGEDEELIWYLASSLEMLHTFSLIHDDLPCMDDDDFRRGKPTNHKVFGEAIAVLAGDALCIHAFELLAKTRNVRCVEVVAHSLGSHGMLGGQVMDILSESKKVSLEDVDYIHYHKTAALLEACLVSGAILADASEEVIQAFSSFGRLIGLAFQIVDDVLDLEQTTEMLGKDAGSDQEKGKATYPSVIGIARSKQKARELIDQALEIIHVLPMDTEILEQIACYIITRVN